MAKYLIGAGLQNLLKLFEYLVEYPFELAAVNHVEIFKQPDTNIKMIY